MAVAAKDTGISAARRATRAALKGRDPRPRVVVQHGSGEHIHVMAVSDAFRGLSMAQRNEVVWPQLRALPMDVLLRISVVMLLTPEEHDDLVQSQRLVAA